MVQINGKVNFHWIILDEANFTGSVCFSHSYSPFACVLCSSLARVCQQERPVQAKSDLCSSSLDTSCNFTLPLIASTANEDCILVQVAFDTSSGPFFTKFNWINEASIGQEKGN